jgi:hypothetical protein
MVFFKTKIHFNGKIVTLFAGPYNVAVTLHHSDMELNFPFTSSRSPTP